MDYPHWLIVLGAALVVIGFIGLAHSRNKSTEANHEPTEMMASGKGDGRDFERRHAPLLAMAAAVLNFDPLRPHSPRRGCSDTPPPRVLCYQTREIRQIAYAKPDRG